VRLANVLQGPPPRSRACSTGGTVWGGGGRHDVAPEPFAGSGDTGHFRGCSARSRSGRGADVRERRVFRIPAGRGAYGADLQLDVQHEEHAARPVKLAQPPGTRQGAAGHAHNRTICRMRLDRSIIWAHAQSRRGLGSHAARIAAYVRLRPRMQRYSRPATRPGPSPASFAASGQSSPYTGSATPSTAYREDNSTVRTGSGPRAMATLK
jgi:hypothetical protein